MMKSAHIYNNPNNYSKNNNLQLGFAMEAIKDIKINLDARILDLGCGDGLITKKIAQKAYNGSAIGTDISLEMINFANEKYKQQKNLKFMQMDASNNIFKNQFDLITSFNCLHWIKDQERVLSGIAKAGINSAQVLLLLSHKKSLYHYTLDYVCSNEKWKLLFKDYINPRSFFTKETYEEMLKNEKFNILSIDETEKSYQFQDTEALKSFFHSSMSQITHLPAELRDAFLSDFTNEYTKTLRDNKINYNVITFWCLKVHAIVCK